MGLMSVNHPSAVPVRRSRDRTGRPVASQQPEATWGHQTTDVSFGSALQSTGFSTAQTGENVGSLRVGIRQGVNRFRRKLESHVALGSQDGEAVERLTASSETFSARSDLTARHETKGGRLILMEGFACRYSLLTGGRRQITAYLVPGDSYDLDAGASNRMDHGVTTLTSARIVRAESSTIEALVQDHPSIAGALRAAEKVEEATLREWLVNIGARPALERIAHLFCEIELRLRAVGLVENDRCDMPITQYDLADTAGLSSVHVNRTLQELRRQGLITLTGRALTIHDRPSLRALAGFEAGYLRLREMA